MVINRKIYSDIILNGLNRIIKRLKVENQEDDL
jgi:hypothetical protein